jgi:hypothetical protein
MSLKMAGLETSQSTKQMWAIIKMQKKSRKYKLKIIYLILIEPEIFLIKNL